MRFEVTASFARDYRRLKPGEREQFKAAVRRFNQACDDVVVAPSVATWPAALRVRSVSSAPGVFEMTWSFSGPDGRATWEWVEVTDREGTLRPAVRWRRLGGHEIFQQP